MTERKTTDLLMTHLPRPLALMAESYIMTDRDGPDFPKLTTDMVRGLDIAAGHFENLFEYRDQNELNGFLAAACTVADIDTIKFMIARGGSGKFAIRISTIMHNSELSKLLISHGADPNDGLNEAINHEDINMARLMISHGADPGPNIFYPVGIFDFVSLGFSLGQIPDGAWV
jgi:hypothetical protein